MISDALGLKIIPAEVECYALKVHCGIDSGAESIDRGRGRIFSAARMVRPHYFTLLYTVKKNIFYRFSM